MIQEDDGYFFGLGAFETIAVENGTPVLLEKHYARLYQAAVFLGLSLCKEQIEEEVGKALEKPEMQTGRNVMKITVSQKNLMVTTRKNTYQTADYEKGFTAAYAKTRRNETSPFTYHKTFNYGDCILEKRKAKEAGIQEPVFLNTKGEIAEGATTNIFFVQKGKLLAPPLGCGMLPGILRQYLYETYEIQEQILLPEMVETFDEMFVTNSLLGIMPVRQLEDFVFPGMEVGRKLLKEYCKEFFFA